MRNFYLMQEHPDGDIALTSIGERELAAIVSAMEIARDQTINAGWRWWHTTLYPKNLYLILKRISDNAA
jgi:hypothetical protein